MRNSFQMTEQYIKCDLIKEMYSCLLQLMGMSDEKLKFGGVDPVAYIGLGGDMLVMRLREWFEESVTPRSLC